MSHPASCCRQTFCVSCSLRTETSVKLAWTMGNPIWFGCIKTIFFSPLLSLSYISSQSFFFFYLNRSVFCLLGLCCYAVLVSVTSMNMCTHVFCNFDSAGSLKNQTTVHQVLFTFTDVISYPSSINGHLFSHKVCTLYLWGSVAHD